MSFYKEVPGRQTTLESTLKFDTKPKAGSTNPVTSDGVKGAIDGAVGDSAEVLQEQIDDIAEKAGSGYIPKGEATVATLNALSGQENGELYTMTDAGTLTDGSLAVVAGDTVAWDATNSVWYKAMNYAPRQYGTNEVHNLPTTITAFRMGDVIPVDGPNGTAKMSKDYLLRETSEKALAGNVAPPFSELNTYAVGDFCIYQGKFYKFIAIHSGAWDDDDVTRVTVKAQFATKSEVNPSTTMSVQNMQSLLGYKVGDKPAKLPPIKFVRGFTNVDFDFPLGDGYYTLATAISAIPLDLRCRGHVITFRVSLHRWVMYQFYGNQDNGSSSAEHGWLNEGSWRKIYDSYFDEKDTHKDITKCFNTIGSFCGSVNDNAGTFVSGGLTFPDGSETVNSKRCRTSFIRCDTGSVVSLEDYDFFFGVLEYDQYKTSITTQTAGEATAKKRYWTCKNKSTRFIRVVTGRLDNAEISGTDADNAITIKSVVKENSNIPKHNYLYNASWTYGSVNISDGSLTNVQNRLRSIRTNANKGTIIHLKNQNDYQFQVYMYMYNTTTNGFLGKLRNDFGVDDLIIDNERCNGIVIVLKKNDNSNFTDTTDSELIEFYRVDENIPLAMPSSPYGYYTSETPANDETSARSYAQLIAIYEDLRTRYPNYVSRTNLGKDQSGTYDIYEYKFAPKMIPIGGTPDGTGYNYTLFPTILLCGGIHGHETPIQLGIANAMSAICDDWQNDERLDYLRHGFIISVIPCLNPWGLENGTRYNSRHVDLNHNFYANGAWENGNDDPTSDRYRGEAPNSEAETILANTWLANNSKAILLIDYHTFGVFTSYQQMCAYNTNNIVNSDRKLLAFIELANKITASAWKNHSLPTSSGILGTSDVANPAGELSHQSEYNGIQSAVVEGIYRYYDGNVGADYNTNTNNVNIEIVVNSILELVKHIYYAHK